MPISVQKEHIADMDQASEFVVATRAALAQLSALAVQYSFSVVGAIVLLIVGWLAAGMFSRWARNGLGRVHGIDATLAQIKRSAITKLGFIGNEQYRNDF